MATFHTNQLPRIACLGLGAMGSRMAKRLLQAGFPVTVWNRTESNAKPLIEAGATLATTPRGAVRDATHVVAMVWDDAASHAVWLDPETGALAGMANGAVAIECSTVTPAHIGMLAGRFAAAGVEWLEAPVVGSRPQAESGQLIALVGGPEVVLEACQPVLAPIAATVVPVGGYGSAAHAKLAANAVFAAQVAALAEALGYLTRSGMPADQAAEVLGRLPVVAPPLAMAVKVMAARSFAPNAPVDLLAKDIGYFRQSGERVGSRTPLAEAVGRLLEETARAGYGGENVTAVSRLYDTTR